MGPLDALWHLLNFGTPAIRAGLLGAVAAKLLWRRELGDVRWRRLAAFGCGGGLVVLTVGLVAFGSATMVA